MILDDIERINLLLETYGVLLTDKQSQVVRYHYRDDLSLNEIAQEFKTSKSAVYDLLKRSVKALEEYEEKLHFVDQYLKREKILDELMESKDQAVIKKVIQLKQMDEKEEN